MTVSNLTTLHCSWASIPGEFYQYLVPILSPVTDNLIFLNQPKRFFFQKRICPTKESIWGLLVYETDKLPTELPHLVTFQFKKATILYFKSIADTMY